MSEDNPENEEVMQEAARWHVQLKKSFSCTICLEFRMNSASTKCQHSFCRKCIEEWIERKGTRGRAKCPVCNAGGLTKRSLEAEEDAMGRQIALVKQFFEVEREELQGELDFLNMTVVSKVLLAFRLDINLIQNFLFRLLARQKQVHVNFLSRQPEGEECSVCGTSKR